MSVTMFTGVYTEQWQLQDFQSCVAWCKANHVDRLCIKVADGVDAWYGGVQPGFSLLKAINFPVLPFVYSYGGDNLQAELALYRQIAQVYGGVCVDAESEWDNHPEYAIALANASIHHLALTTWANPGEHAWLQSINALGAVVDEWVPQAYYDDLYSKMLAQYPASLKLSPALSVEFPGAVDSFVSLCKTTGETNDDLFVWHYLSAKPSSLFAQGALAYESARFPNRWMMQSALEEWNSTPLRPIPNYNTGIAAAWRDRVYANKRPGHPTSQEFKTVDWNGVAIVAQTFDYARAEWTGSKARWFGPSGEEV